MEDTNHQDAVDIEPMDNIENIDYNSSDIEEYDEVIELDENTLQRLKQDDPSVTHLSLSLSASDQNYLNYFNKIDWKVDGDCISNNTHLKKLRVHVFDSISADHKHRQQLEDFFSCVYRNRSINVIDINLAFFEFAGSLIFDGLGGHPSIIRLEITSYSKPLGSLGCEVLGKILKHSKCKLRDLRLSRCILDDDSRINLLFDALSNNSTLKKLSLSLFNNTSINTVGCQSLSAVIRHTNCKLTKLSLSSTGLNDETVNILGSALSGSSVKVLDLSSNYSITNSGWQTLLNQISKAPIINLDLSSSQIDDTSLVSLANISTLKCLDLCCNSSITQTGWESFFNTLRQRGFKLVDLNIAENNIGYEGSDALSRLISNMSTLKTLGMNDMDYPQDYAWVWVSFFDTMWGSNLDLVELYLSGNSINDDGIEILTDLVSSMPSLKLLNFGYNRLVTPFGWWQALSEILESPNFALKELDLSANKIDDDTMIVFANALAGNKTLKLLHLYQDPQEITKKGWEAINSSLQQNKYHGYLQLQSYTSRFYGRSHPI